MKVLFPNVPGRLAVAGAAPSVGRQTVMLAAFCFAAAALMFPEVAMAGGGAPLPAATPGVQLKSGQSIATIATNAKASLQGVGVIITYVSYVAALIFTFSSLLKFKAYSEHPDRTEMKVPLTLLGLAAGFAAIGEVLGTGIASIWGGGTNIQFTPTI